MFLIQSITYILLLLFRKYIVKYKPSDKNLIELQLSCSLSDKSPHLIINNLDIDIDPMLLELSSSCYNTVKEFFSHPNTRNSIDIYNSSLRDWYMIESTDIMKEKVMIIDFTMHEIQIYISTMRFVVPQFVITNRELSISAIIKQLTHHLLISSGSIVYLYILFIRFRNYYHQLLQIIN